MFTRRNDLIKKYVPQKFILGSQVSVDNTGFTLSKDEFVCVFPSIMKFMEADPFGGEEKLQVFRLRWCAYVISQGEYGLLIGNDETFQSLASEVEKYFQPVTWQKIPIWYVQKVQQCEQQIADLFWLAHQNRHENLFHYLIVQWNYGFMEGETKSEKPFLFPDTDRVLSIHVDKI